MTEEVWRERDTTPSKIEAALRNLLIERYHDEDAFVPARVLNLVVVVDGEFRGEIENRLERVGRYHPSRLVICAVHAGRKTIDAWCSVAAEDAEGAVLARARAGRARDRRAPPEGARHDRRPAARARPRDRRVGAARARRGGRLAAAADAGRARRLAGRARRARRVRARQTSCSRAPTSSTSRGCARRRGASASPPPSTRRRCGAGWARSRRSPSATAPTRWRPRCCSAAGCARGWAGARARSPPAAASAGPRTPARAAARSRCASKRSSSRARPGSRASRSRWRRAARCRSTAAPAGCKSVRRDARRQGAGVDRARRLARRGGHPRRGRPPGAAARSHLQAGAVGGARAPVDRLAPHEGDHGAGGPWSRGGRAADRGRRGRRPDRAHRRLDSARRVRARRAGGRRLEPRDRVVLRRADGPARPPGLELRHGHADAAVAALQAPDRRARSRASSGPTRRPAPTRRCCASAWARTRAST